MAKKPDSGKQEKQEPPTAVEEMVKGYMMFVFGNDKEEYWYRMPVEWKPSDPFTKTWQDIRLNCVTTDSTYSKGAKPGQIFEFDFSADRKRIFYSKKFPAKVVGLAPTDVHLECLARHDDAQAAIQLKKGSQPSEVLKFLDPIREAYKRLPSPARAQLMARIVRYITAG